MLKGIIFDFDGTLFDSMSVWHNAGEMYLRTVGREPEKGLASLLKDMSLQQAAACLRQRYRLPLSPGEVMAGINRTVEAFYLHTVLPKAGAAALLNALHRQKIPMCIATATDRYLVEAALERCGMRHFFPEILTSSMVGCGKDQPHIYRMAAQQLGGEKSSVLVVEDACYAIATAKRDGFTVVGVHDAYETDTATVKALADIYLPDYSQLTDFWKLVERMQRS